MEKIITAYPSVPFGELVYCYENEILYQKDTSISVPYEKDYFEKYVSYEDTEISIKLNEFRTAITKKYCKSLLDIGIGSGEFIKKSSIKVFGYDINPIAIEWLNQRGLLLDPYTGKKLSMRIEGVSLWDALEHIPDPSDLLSRFSPGQYVFISIPIFSDLLKVRESKHYRPNEHYYYYTEAGLRKFMAEHRFKFIEMSDAEIQAGREGIYSFVFRRNP